MKRLKSYVTGLAVMGLLCVTCLAIILSNNIVGKSQDVSFSVSADKQAVYLGEMVRLEFQFYNRGEYPVQIPSGGVMSGNVRILIAKEGSDYREYNTSGWGRKPEKVVTLGQQQVFRADNTNATILWNFKPDYSHLNADAAKAEDKQRKAILTNYAFPEAGTYFVKAISCVVDGTKGCSIPIESKPIKITVSEPRGEDLEVWQKLKHNPKLGQFMQHSGTSKSDINLIGEIEQIINQYPSTFYAQSLRQSLDRFHEKEAERKAYLEKLEHQKRP